MTTTAPVHDGSGRVTDEELLRVVTEARKERDDAHLRFQGAVWVARDHGLTIRKIMAASGLSTHTVQKWGKNRPQQK